MITWLQMQRDAFTVGVLLLSVIVLYVGFETTYRQLMKKERIKRANSALEAYNKLKKQ